MYELNKSEEISRLIDVTKSNSGISGPDLAKAHIALGEILGQQMKGIFVPEETTIVAFLRGGVFFAEGMYFSMKCKFQVYDPKHEEFVRPESKKIILVDSVINTGKTILDVYSKDMYVACCVINEKAVPLFEERLFTVRVSQNSFIGANVKKQEKNVGPDTTMRLFNQL